MKNMLMLAKKISKNTVFAVVMAVVIGVEAIMPQPVHAQTFQMPKFLAFLSDRFAPAETIDIAEAAEKEVIADESEATPKPKKVMYVTVTAYSSDPAQTDDTPCITANGLDVCKHNIENIVAANFMKFGTQIRFPDYKADQYFYVNDRMNARYTERIDIWMKSKEAAKQFGIKRLKVEIY